MKPTPSTGRSIVDDGLADRLGRLTQAQRSCVLGMIGTSLLRDWFLGGADQRERLEDLFAAVRVLDGRTGDGSVPREVLPRDGYAQWAATYDQPNPMVEAEEELVHSLLAAKLRPGNIVLDAACGTGRHLAWLEGVDCRAIGVDLTKPMLQRASVAAPSARLLQCDLRALALGSGSVDAVICSLALCHVPDLVSALRELARVLKPGGTLVVSDPHGRAAYAGGQGFFGAGGVTRPRFVRNHYRQAHEWFDAFRTCGFAIESCHEPGMSAADAARHPVAEFFPAAAVAALCEVPYLWVWSVSRYDD
jgi:ubiquinone/menaquinone biosynthesis C-methylase UbiE